MKQLCTKEEGRSECRTACKEDGTSNYVPCHSLLTPLCLNYTINNIMHNALRHLIIALSQPKVAKGLASADSTWRPGDREKWKRQQISIAGNNEAMIMVTGKGLLLLPPALRRCLLIVGQAIRGIRPLLFCFNTADLPLSCLFLSHSGHCDCRSASVISS